MNVFFHSLFFPFVKNTGIGLYIQFLILVFVLYYIIFVSILSRNLSHIPSLALFEALGIWATNSCAFFPRKNYSTTLRILYFHLVIYVELGPPWNFLCLH